MTRVSATEEGVPTPLMGRYYAAFARGGFGLIITEGIYPDAERGQGYARQPGLVTEAQVAGWRRVTDAVHEAGGVVFAQLMHAGALSQCLSLTCAPSAVQPKGAKMPAYGGSGPFPLPLEMSVADIADAVAAFGRAARHAREAGFDGIEIHGANGYLVDQFITSYTNLRRDEYGGDVWRRARFAREVLRAAKGEAGEGFPVGIRLSQTKVNDFSYRWRPDEARILLTEVAREQPAYLHLASEGRDWWQTARLSPDGLTVTRLAREVTGLPVIANGGMHRPELAEEVLREGHADLVSLARGALANPDWPRRLREGAAFNEFHEEMIHPNVSLEHAAACLS